MNDKFIKNPFWYLFGPMLAYWLIGFAVKFVAEVLLLTPQIGVLVKESLASGAMSQEQIMQMVMSKSVELYKVLLNHQVEILAIGSAFTIPVTVYFFHTDRKREEAFLIPKIQKAKPVKYIWLFIFGIAACIGLNGLSFITSIALYSPEYQETSQILYTPTFPVQLVCLGIIVPIAEELIFRGVLFKRIRAVGSFKKAAMFSTLLFGMSHGNIVQLVFALILGMFLAYVYEKYGSFIAPLSLHITVNITSLLLTETGAFQWLSAKALRLAIATVFCAFVGSIMFVMIQRMEERVEIVIPKDEITSTKIDE